MAPAATATPSLDEFLATLGAQDGLRARLLAHAWQAAGGSLQVGRLSVRLVHHDANGRPFTAGTLHREPARLELARVILRSHGITQEAWQAWCDERPELRAHGFLPSASFPTVALATLADGAAARLALGVRDLALAVRPAPAGAHPSASGA